MLITVALHKLPQNKTKTKTIRPNCVQISSRGLVLKTISTVQCANSRYTFHDAVIRPLPAPTHPPKTKHDHNSPFRSSSARTKQCKQVPQSCNDNRGRTVARTHRVRNWVSDRQKRLGQRSADLDRSVRMFFACFTGVLTSP